MLVELDCLGRGNHLVGPTWVILLLETMPKHGQVSINLLKLINISWRENKGNTTMKEVWICDPNHHKIRRSFALIFSKNYQCFEKLYQTLERVFHQTSKHFEVRQKKTRLHLVFSTHFLVFGYLMRHSSSCLMYYLTTLLFWNLAIYYSLYYTLTNCVIMLFARCSTRIVQHMLWTCCSI